MEKTYQESYYYNRMKDERLKKRFLRDKRRVFLRAIGCTFFLILFHYFMTDASNVYKVAIRGNKLLSDKAVLRLAGVKPGDKYWLVFSPQIRSRLYQNDLIKKAIVKHENGNVIAIEIVEKEAYAYYYQEGSTYLWAEEGTMVALDASSFSFLRNIPLIEGYTPEQLAGLEKHFRELLTDTLGEISEIHRYPMSYDDAYMEVIMRDGNYVFLSPFALKHLNSYYSVASGLGSKKRVCLYFDEVTGTGYSSACPWQTGGEKVPPPAAESQTNP